MSSGTGWDATHVTLRMTSRRRSQLARIAASLHVAATPSEAVDAALERSGSQARELSDRVDALEDMVAASAMASRDDADRIAMEIGLLAELVRGLNRALSDALQAD